MKRKLLLSAILFVTLFSFGQGNLLVNPVRVVFEGAKQNEDLNLTNIGKDTAVYLVSLVSYKMNENGSFQLIEKSDSSFSADRFLRFFPRKVILPPSESQAIRLQLRKPKNLKTGEFRSHIYFRAEKEKSPLGFKDPNIDSTKVAIRITPIFGITIPVIVRNGNLTNSISLDDPQISLINDSTYKCSVIINRIGLKSAYGNLKIEFLSESGQKFDVGLASGIGVYPEINKRYFSLIIKNASLKNKGSGKLIYKFLAPPEEGGVEIAKTEFSYTF